jgi:mRNA-degrading endonuclease RelE of RelBE toxin-antitoxin system
MYVIEFADGVKDDLADLSAFDRTQILDRIDEQLTFQPTVETRNRKPLIGLVPPWDHVEPVWELRIGEYRVFYDVADEVLKVIVRAVRHKPPHATTEEIL